MNRRYSTMKSLLGGNVADYLSKQVDLKVREVEGKGGRIRAIELAAMRGKPHEYINSLVEDTLLRQGERTPKTT